MAKCIVMNIEDPKCNRFEVCVNGDKPKIDCITDVEIDLDEKFIHALENTMVETMVPDDSKSTKLGEVYRIPKKTYRYRIVRLEKKREPETIVKLPIASKLEEGVSPIPFKKPKGNPNWKKHKMAEPVEAETGHQLTEA